MKNQLKTIALMGALSALVVGFGALVAPGSLTLFVLLALAMNLGAYFFSDRLVLRMHHAREIGPDEVPGLHDLVQELSTRAGIPMPRVYLIHEAQPNAFATGRNPAHGVVAVTTGLLELLSERELLGVIAHEIAHIKNRDILVSSMAAAGASIITYLAHALSFSSVFGGSNNDEDSTSTNPVGGLLAALVAPIAATLIQLGISRSREYLADDTGARISGDPEALASALIRLEHASERIPVDAASPATASLFIVNPFGPSQALSRWFSTHPSTAERVERLSRIARSLGRRIRPSVPIAGSHIMRSAGHAQFW